MTGEEAIAYIHSIDWRGSRLGLSRTQELLRMMGNPERFLHFVHIAGTNGKGSTAAMIASVLREAGYRTGLYTSPYIRRFHERMQIGGIPISDGALGEITAFVRLYAEKMKEPPTEFELVTAIALEWFRREGCKIVVLEVGLGGRLDSTNVIPVPMAAVIARIGLDHVQELGKTLELIAAEKAGIIKTGGDVVVYPQTIEVMDVLRRVCEIERANLHIADFSMLHPIERSLDGQVFDYGKLERLQLSLLGAHQLENAAVALTALRVLEGKGFSIPERAVRAGLAHVKWPGRFEVVCKKPVVIIDGAHNQQGAMALAEALDTYLPGRQAVCLTGVLNDKDYAAMMDQIAPRAGAFVAVQPESGRALGREKLKEFLTRYGKPVEVGDTIAAGVQKALALAGEEGVVVVFGSLYMIGQARHCLMGE